MATPSVKDIVVIDTKGSWETKSGGFLSVLLKLDFELVERLLDYPEEIRTIDKDIRGIRSYTVEHIPAGSIGANEWHKIRTEVIFCTKGTVKWTCKDTAGNTAEFIVSQDTAILTPRRILHKYQALEDDSAIGVLANTLFFPEDPSTHDTFLAETF